MPLLSTFKFTIFPGIRCDKNAFGGHFRDHKAIARSIRCKESTLLHPRVYCVYAVLDNITELLQEFGITEPSTNYTLCEVSVAEGGFVKQRTLPDQLKNLAERIGLASRYYIKNIHDSEALLPDDNVNDLQKEAHVTLLQLNPVEVSTQLMVEDFTIFRQIEATEYVEDLFEIKSRYGTPNLNTFSALVNREMMWVISEIVAETNIHKRMRGIKQFIKIARQCKETQNFNSMFAIISGLGHGAVTRLKSTWEKLPGKYLRLFQEMQQLMDPSRNMSRYRNLINAENVQPPIIPFWPVVKKDLTFIHLGNDSKVDGMINFEKLRMIAKEVRFEQCCMSHVQISYSISSSNRDEIPIRFRQRKLIIRENHPKSKQSNTLHQISLPATLYFLSATRAGWRSDLKTCN